MNTGKLRKYIFLAALAIFVLLLAHYAIAPNRWYTQRMLKPQGDQIGHDYMLSSLNVTTIAQDSHKQIWIGTSAGINVYNGYDYTQFFHNPTDTTALPDDYINVIVRDSRGRMWIGTQNGLARHEGSGLFHRLKLPSANCNIISLTEEPSSGNIIASNGSEWFSISNDSVMRVPRPRYLPQPASPIDQFKSWSKDYPEAQKTLNKPEALISCTFKDAGGNLWLGYRNAGYQVLSENNISYRIANDNPIAQTTRGKDITCLNTTGGYILAGTTLRLYVYDTNTHSVTYRYYDQLFGAKDILTGIVTLDSSHICLVGHRHILLCALENGNISVQQNIACSQLLGAAALVGDDVYISCKAPYIIRYSRSTSRLDSIAVNHAQYDEETQVTTLHDGRLMLFMKNMQLAVLDPKQSSVHELKTTGAPLHGNIDPAFVRQDSRGKVWLGTKRYGLFWLDLEQGRVERKNFVGDVHIQGMVEDRQQQIWITTLKDAISYQPATGAVLMNSLVSSSQNAWNRQYFDNSLCIAPNGDIVLGSSDGCIFLPHKAGNKMQIANKHNNRPYDQSRALENGLCIYALGVQTVQGKKLLADIPLEAKPLTLARHENNLDFSFFYPNYSRRSSLMFQYKLEGYDNAWSNTTYEHTAHYANLAPGKYTFRLRLMSSPHLAPLNEKTIHVTIMPAPWACAAAWWLYACVALVAVYFVNRLYLRIRTSHMLLQQEKREREREQLTNEMNMNFFANISHEFRNPITLIAGPLLSLKTDSSLPQRTRHTLDRVCMSVNRMLRLIDQMLDFNQLETDALRLKVSGTDAQKQIRLIIDTFEESARVRGISLENCIAPGSYDAWIDVDKLEKIMSNLFTNALKYTPTGGTIRITVRSEDERLYMKIYNSGSHIADDKLQYVFLRYYQLPDSAGLHQYGWGTGIGLYYVKRLVGLHHGSIEVCNEQDGVAFSLWLPTGEESYSDAERSAQATRVMQIPLEQTDTEKPEAEADADSANIAARPKILVVDDDIDVAQYIRSLFEDNYTVENRFSAEEALADLEALHPDIILSDIVMGGMSGYEFCSAVKSNLMFSHTPVILITAKSNMEEQIRGLQQGAMAYITKPFDPAYLKAMVETLLTNIRCLRQHLGESTTTDELSPTVADSLSAQDRKFMDELYSLMERHLAEQDLNVVTVSHDLLISQSKFNYKLKQLTGDTPGTFFRRYKLNKAALWLKEDTYNVSEVAIKTGFSTAAHFSVAFKKQFGVPPSDYR